jgi:metal-responsive CopG/Arc/MetJ family transcriptional regulator
MKTIAITIEEAVLDRLDRLPHKRGEKKRNRSQIIREAVAEALYVRRHIGGR